MNQESHCPLCASNRVREFHRDRRRDYLRCDHCALVFVPPEFHLSAAAEKAEYDLHCNETGDPGYRAFLGRLAGPLAARLDVGARGLDFGCGPGPALAAMLAERGFSVKLYDIFYYPDKTVLEQHYDFICATEVVEHLSEPGAVLERLWGLLKPGAYLGVMTKLVRDREAFARWHYKNDPTHICFFSEQTWRWWARNNGAVLERFDADVMLLQRGCY